MIGRIIGGLFGGRSEPADHGTYYYVRCAKCGEAIRIRIDRANDLAQDYEDGGDSPSGFTAQKGIVGKKCFRVMTMTLRFDRQSRETDRSIDGGEFITREEYEASQSADTTA